MSRLGERIGGVVGKKSWLVDHSTDILLIMIGALFIVIGLVVRQASLPIDGGVTAQGRIVGHVVSRQDDDKRPTIEFTDASGAVHRFDSKVGGFLFEGDVGDVVEVTYDPDDPSRVEVAENPGRWLWFLLCGAGVALWLGELGLLGCRRVKAGRPPGPSG